MFYVIVTDEGYYPSVIVLKDEEKAEEIYKAMVSGFNDWCDEWVEPVDGNVELFKLSNTKLKTRDWSSTINQLPLCDGVEFVR